MKTAEKFEHYRKIKLLGEGSFGKAYLIERLSDKLMCVMKTIELSRMSEGERRKISRGEKSLKIKRKIFGKRKYFACGGDKELKKRVPISVGSSQPVASFSRKILFFLACSL